jgi:hypothetical protein
MQQTAQKAELLAQPSVLAEDRTCTLPPAGLEAQVQVAAKLQAVLDRNAATGVCAVCSLATPPPELTLLPLGAVPHLELLRCDGPPTPEAPRHAHTRASHAGVDYCLQPLGITGVCVSSGRVQPLLAGLVTWCATGCSCSVQHTGLVHDR